VVAFALCLIVLATIAVALMVFPFLRSRRRQSLAQQPVPPSWREWLSHYMPPYLQMPSELRERLHGLTAVFLQEKRFVGCNGLTVTDEMRVVIAAHACLLVLNRPGVPLRQLYDELLSILVYPTPFVVRETHHDDDGVVTEGEQVLSGQAWDAQRIILSWEDIAQEPEPGYNVVLHEFAHYLDMEDETMDGAPGLGSAAAYQAWSEIFWDEFERLQDDIDSGHDTFLDPYAATEPAEFFAVVTEAFFLQPRELETEHSLLYAQLRKYYRVDPARWIASGSGLQAGLAAGAGEPD
jgi:MtfA peptidase